MNTSSVAKQLGVSSSTVKRWVKQLKLNLEKNEMGHFTYRQEDVDLLITYKEQQNEALLVYTEISAGKDYLRRGTVHTSMDDDDSVLLNRIKCLESIVQSKADQVVEYQILQHRREMEEMQATLEKLEERIRELEAQQVSPSTLVTPSEQPINIKPRRKKKHWILQSLFRSSTQHSS
ncbi:MerR family transcriptional regulator [Robertmurraya sp. FSL R5-0851]|uniref:MerR family transcriptional regulator n=1 Tax=Robertmurraya sp. FSL R5-0851 TaxID=2921584 RepID=UPI0030F5C3FC